MTPRQIDLVKQSFAKIMPYQEQAAELSREEATEETVMRHATLQAKRAVSEANEDGWTGSARPGPTDGARS